VGHFIIAVPKIYC